MWSWRTAQQDQSVVAVGDVLKREMEAYGFTVLHDTMNHEPPKLSTSYSRSLVTMKEYIAAYPTISVFIDVHRDSGNDKHDFVTVDGEECARVMFIVGAETTDNTSYESNLALVSAVTNQLESIKKGFTRPIRMQTRKHNYNQQVSDMCLLIEVGHTANSLEQAKNTAKYVALALSRVLSPQTP